MDPDQNIKKAMLGDAQAMEILISTYYNQVYAFCCRKTGDAALGADVCQDTFIKMVKSLPKYRERGYFKSWLFTIASNCCTDALRKQKPTGQLIDEFPDESNNFNEYTENSEIVKAALNQLVPAQKEAIILQYYHGFTAKEIARVQGIPTATVKTRVYRGVKKLRELLAEDYDIA